MLGQSVEKKLEAVDDYIIEGNYDYAEKLLIKILRKDDGIHEAHYKLAMVLWQTDKPKRALEEAVKAVSQKPEDANYQALLGKLWVENSQGDKALEAFERALLYNAYLPEAFLYRGDYYMEQEAWDKAISDFMHLDSLVPGQPEIYFRLAHCHHGKLKYKPAIHNYQKALEINPLDNESRFGLSLCFYETGSYANAIFHLNQLINMEGEFVDYLHQRAQCYVQLDKLSEAKIDLIKARKLESGNTEVVLTLIGLEERLGNYDAAISLLDQNIARFEGMRILYVWKGRILAKQGQFKSANRNFGFAAEGMESGQAYSQELMVYQAIVAYLADESSFLPASIECDAQNPKAVLMARCIPSKKDMNIDCLNVKDQELSSPGNDNPVTSHEWMLSAIGHLYRDDPQNARISLEKALTLTNFEDSEYHFAEILYLNL